MSETGDDGAHTLRVEANVDGDPILTPDGALLIGSDDGSVYALRADAIPARTRDAGTP